MSKRDSRVLQIERTLRAAEGLSGVDLEYVCQRLRSKAERARKALSSPFDVAITDTLDEPPDTEDEPDPELGF